MTNSGANDRFRSIPSMEELLNAPWALELSTSLGREQVKSAINQALGEIRGGLSRGTPSLPVSELVVLRVEDLLRKKTASTLKPVVNAAGVVVHTNLGRAPLAPDALKVVERIAGRYSTLEYSPETGGRGGRNNHIEWLICRITGAEAALAVNNNAAAVLLSLSALAAGREVIVSSGELVEIGGSFRIPDILAFSGAKMCAVGCTNSARIGDYSAAITENTAVLLKVHPSNFRIEGFVQSVSRKELAELAASRRLVFMEDLGSGLLCPLSVPFAEREQTVRDCLREGCGIVTFSGDKLLGGPQIGVAAGSKFLIDKMRRHQLLRALRVDKMTLAAFEATLRLYLTGRQAEIPVIQMIEADSDALLARARNLRRLLLNVAAKNGISGVEILVVETEDAVGGGAFPCGILPGYGVAISFAGQNAETIASAFRLAAVPVIPAIHNGQAILHVRTLLAGDEKIIAAAFLNFLNDDKNKEQTGGA
jgi:L-seryl-tRNA(Ser) seleniumtransferase